MIGSGALVLYGVIGEMVYSFTACSYNITGVLLTDHTESIITGNTIDVNAGYVCVYLIGSCMQIPCTQHITVTDTSCEL